MVNIEGIESGFVQLVHNVDAMNALDVDVKTLNDLVGGGHQDALPRTCCHNREQAYQETLLPRTNLFAH